MGLLILALIIIVLVAAFSVQNAAPVTISFLLWKFQASLAIVTFLSVLIGAVIATIITFWFSLKKPKKENKGKLPD
jgi:lipopolysaccharide assembly protein A